MTVCNSNGLGLVTRGLFQSQSLYSKGINEATVVREAV